MKKIYRLITILLMSLMIIGILAAKSIEGNAAGSIKVTLSDIAYTYTGKAYKPKVKVKYKGKKLSSKDYTVKYGKGRKKVGKYSVKIKLKGKYKGSKTVYFTIYPEKSEIQDIQPEKGGFSISWTPITEQISGYQIMYGKDENFSDKTEIKVDKINSKSINGLEGGLNYYVIIRTYTEVKDKTYYSEWSEVESVVPIKVYRFRNENLRSQHYDKHGREMGFPSEAAYEEAASDVVLNPAALHKIEKEDGDDCYYLEATNDFVVVSRDGYIRTYFRPDSGKSYFDKQ